MKTIREYASRCERCVEFGCQQGRTAVAMLMECRNVTSYDITETPESRELKTIAPHWLYRIQDSVIADFDWTDLLFIDSFHSHEQVKRELGHADRVRKYLLFHDSITFGSVSAADERGNMSWTYKRGKPVPPEHIGIRPAIDQLMIRDPSWRIDRHDTHSHGLLVLRRQCTHSQTM